MANPHPIKILYPEQVFEPKDALGAGVKAGTVGAVAGFIASAVQNSLAKRNVGALGVFTRTGGTIATFSMSLR
jgi:hypothetical protein